MAGCTADVGSAKASSMVQSQTEDQRPAHHLHGLAKVSDGPRVLYGRPQRPTSISEIHTGSFALSSNVLGLEPLSRICRVGCTGSAKKIAPYNLSLLTHQQFKLIFLIFCMCVERLY